MQSEAFRYKKSFEHIPRPQNIQIYITILVPGTIFVFDICNLKPFAMKNRLSIVPSLQNIKMIQLLMISIPKDVEMKNGEQYF